MYSAEMFNLIPLVRDTGFFNSHNLHYATNRTEPRITDCWQIEIYTSSDGAAIINGEQYSNDKMKILICPPNTKRQSILHFSCYFFHLDIAAGEYLNKFNNLPLFSEISSFSHYNEIIDNCKKMIQLFYSDNQTDFFKFNELFLVFLNTLFAVEKTDISANSSTLSVVSVAEKYIDTNFMNNISLKDIASAVSLSPVYFHRIYTDFRKHSPHDYLMSKRLDYAKFFLLSSDMPIGEIAFVSGFSSQSYFNSVFKKFTFVTPKQFRILNSKQI